MKKEVKKLKLNKVTISNLDASEMNQRVGGAKPTRPTWDTLKTLCGGCDTWTSIACPIPV